MQENHQATKYFIKFTQLAARVQWGQAALLRQACNGLTKRIKNDMVHHDKPTTLSDLRKLVQAIDSCYWECKVEISRKMLPGLPGINQRNLITPRPRRVKVLQSLNRRTRTRLQAQPRAKEAPRNPRSQLPDLSSKLGKDDKLTPQERQHRLDKNLCLFCGASGHMAKDCPKSTSAAAKAHAALTTPTLKSTLTPKSSELKKD